jgi:hypothetical protein
MKGYSMNRILSKYSLMFGVAVLVAAAVSPVVANAHPGHVHTAQQGTDDSQSTEELKAMDQQSTTKSSTEDRKEAVQTRLADNKLKMCQNRQKAITNITARIADRGQKQIDLFSKIAERTESFYVSKGKTLATYDALVADVAAKKAAAQSVADATTSDSTVFDCSSNDPKGSMSSFKDKLKLEIDAIKAYKTSVKNLIVGVKSVQGTTSSEKEVQR